MTRPPASTDGPAGPACVDARDPLDVAAIDKLRALIGDAKVKSLLSRLSDQLASVVTETAIASCDRAELARTAHAAVSSAGVLGFRTFARLCADLEAACATDNDLSDLRSRVVAERHLMAERLERLAAELGGAPVADRIS